MPKLIKIIIFDFAGVVSSTMFPPISEFFGKKTGIGKEKFHGLLHEYEREYLLGEISTREFWEKVCNELNISLQEFEEELGRYALDKEVVQLVKNLKKKYQVVLLTDNYDALYKQVEKDVRIKSLFEKIYYSNLVHLTKKYNGKEFFLYVLKDLQVASGECVFIDDKEKNLIQAKEIGINVIHFKNYDQLKKELLDFSVNV